MALNILEQECLASFGRERPAAPGTDWENWLRFSLMVVLEACHLVRRERLYPSRAEVEFKGDGSPFTVLELRIEELIRQRLAQARPDAVFIGEESGGDLPESGYALALDPLDGTWGYINHVGVCATSLAVFVHGIPWIGVVANPASGEVGYAVAGQGARLLQLGLFGAEDDAADLPTALPKEDSNLLINVQPSPQWGEPLAMLHHAWKRREVRMVKSMGGSPSWALLEAARGYYTYVNLWSKKPAAPYDLAAGTLLVREAGGEVMDIKGHPINPICHSGPFVAGLSRLSRKRISAILTANKVEEDGESHARGLLPGTPGCGQ